VFFPCWRHCLGAEFNLGTGMLLRLLEFELRWSVPVATMTGNRWHVEDSVSASLHISLLELVVRVDVVRRWRVWPTIGMWPGQQVVVPHVIVFYDDIKWNIEPICGLCVCVLS
jgi:hypothetical protein